VQDILDIFQEITKIEHCSYNTTKLKNYIINFAKNYGYEVKTDSAGNILVTKGNPKICLQAHYDMVCVGDAPNIEVEIKDGIIKAKNSSLGADNGMAIAMMLNLAKEQYDIEFLFTNDEEVGLIGAKNLELTLQSKYLLNLDSEDEALVFIGCAGGIDATASKTLQKAAPKENFYQVEIAGLQGGHSGVDIDKNIPNAIVELLKVLDKSNTLICSISGGVATNAIPAYAKAIISANNFATNHPNIKVTKLEKSYLCYKLDFAQLINLPNGAISYNSQFDVVQNSQNLGIINLKDGNLSLSISMRSMDNNELEKLKINNQNLLTKQGFKVEFFDKYPAWRPETNSFTDIVLNSLQKNFGKANTLVIHAGLECGILKQKYPNILFASIGPNIKYPHSTNEQCEIESVFKTYDAVLDIIKNT
jgi:dipeptidase D